MPETLTVRFENDQSGLELTFTPSGIRTCDAVARIRQGGLDLRFSFYCFGFDLAEFAREMESLHVRYEGLARFVNQWNPEGSLQLELSLVHPGRGVIGVVVTLEQWIAWPSDWAPVRQQAERRALVFHGFTVEQSYLPSLISRVRQFLADTGISTARPE
jgi:hypothetical protein